RKNRRNEILVFNTHVQARHAGKHPDAPAPARDRPRTYYQRTLARFFLAITRSSADTSEKSGPSTLSKYSSNRHKCPARRQALDNATKTLLVALMLGKDAMHRTVCPSMKHSTKASPLPA